MVYDKVKAFELSAMSDEEVLQRIGGKIKELRLAQNVKQKELAEKSGLSMFSISQMETGHNTSMQSIIQVLRALGKMELLALLLSPTQGDERNPSKQRVSRGCPLQGEDLIVSPENNKHKSICYQLTEDTGFSIAAEQEPDLNR